MALSNQPFALPIIAWGCVMFGNAPTRTTDVCDCSNAETPMIRHTVNLRIAFATEMRLAIFIHFSRTAFARTTIGKTLASVFFLLFLGDGFGLAMSSSEV